jgi:hypothetical protein
VSVPEVKDSLRPVDAVAGFLASAAVFLALIGLGHRPIRLTAPAVVLALIAAGMSERFGRLAAFAAVFGGICFIVGTSLAVITRHPLF